MTEQIVEDIHNIAEAVPTGDENTVWKSFYSIKTDLDFDPKASDYEKDILSFLNRHLSDALRQKALGSIGSRLSGLKSSIERRTIGEQGWRL